MKHGCDFPFLGFVSKHRRSLGSVYALTRSVVINPIPLRPQAPKAFATASITNPYASLFRFVGTFEYKWLAHFVKRQLFPCALPCRNPAGIEVANPTKLLVPIRIHVDVENYKIREQFIWNVNESIVSVCKTILLTSPAFIAVLDPFMPLIVLRL